MTHSREWSVQREQRLAWHAFEQEIAIVVPGSSSIHTVDGVGARFWELADGRSYGEIVDTLLAEFEVDRQTLEADLEEFVAELEKRGLLETSAP